MDLRGENALANGTCYGVEVQDYILRRILEEANLRKLTYQIHTGMTNLANSNPALLEDNIKSYPNINFTLLHCYPYINEASYLARSFDKKILYYFVYFTTNRFIIIHKCFNSKWRRSCKYYSKFQGHFL